MRNMVCWALAICAFAWVVMFKDEIKMPYLMIPIAIAALIILISVSWIIGIYFLRSDEDWKFWKNSVLPSLKALQVKTNIECWDESYNDGARHIHNRIVFEHPESDALFSYLKLLAEQIVVEVTFFELSQFKRLTEQCLRTLRLKLGVSGRSELYDANGILKIVATLTAEYLEVSVPKFEDQSIVDDKDDDPLQICYHLRSITICWHGLRFDLVLPLVSEEIVDMTPGPVTAPLI